MLKSLFLSIGFMTAFHGLKWDDGGRFHVTAASQDDSTKGFRMDTLYLSKGRDSVKGSCMEKIILALGNDIIPANPRALDDEPASSVEERIDSKKTVFNHFNKDLKTRNFSKIKVQLSTYFFSKYSQSQEFDDVIMISEWHLKNEAEAKSLFNDLNKIPISNMSYELTVFSNEWLWYHHSNKVYFLTFPSYVEEFPFKDHVGQIMKSVLREECAR